MSTLKGIEEILRFPVKHHRMSTGKRNITKDTGIVRRVRVCVAQMKQIKRSESPDGYVWRCLNHKGRKKSIRTGSCIENSKPTLRQFVSVINAWSMNLSRKMAAVMAGPTGKTMVDWFNFHPEVGTFWTERNPRVVGGRGHIVQIDATCVSKAK